MRPSNRSRPEGAWPRPDPGQRALSYSATQPPRPLTQGRPVCLHAWSRLLGPRVEGDGDLEPRQDRLELSCKILWLSVIYPDKGYGPRPKLLVGHGHDHRLVDFLQSTKGLLYLLGLNVLAARDKEVVHAPSDPQVAAFVELAEVSGMEPAFRVHRSV